MRPNTNDKTTKPFMRQRYDLSKLSLMTINIRYPAAKGVTMHVRVMNARAVHNLQSMSTLDRIFSLEIEQLLPAHSCHNPADESMKKPFLVPLESIAKLYRFTNTS